MNGDPAPPGDELPAPRHWPADRPPDDAEAVAVTCAACRQPWRVHQRMRGFRLRCSCGAWIELPPPPAALAPAARELPALPAATAPKRRADGLVEIPGDDGDVIYQLIPTDQPVAPGTLRRASHGNQARWTNRTVLEFALLMAALLVPQLAAWLLARGSEFELLLPFASLLSGVLVALVVAWAGPYGWLGFRAAAAPRYLEALGLAAAGVAVAWLYSHLLGQLLPDVESDPLPALLRRLGLVGALFVIAVTPAVLEEVIFRGLLQGRLLALYGHRLGLGITAVAFAVCHGQPLALPIHLALGLVLGWLRERSQSLLPGMLLHFAYNGTLVVLAGW